MSSPLALITDCAGTSLTPEEKRLFARADPYGFILFARNCESPAQVRALVSEMKECVGRGDVPVLIDQEGGRVARLKPPHWPAFPPAGVFSALAERDRENACEAAYLNARLMAEELAALGVNVDCAPVADIPVEGAHDIIGDRAYGCDPQQVAMLAGEVARGLMDGGVIPVVKHIPGHGRATADSHYALPVVDASLEELRRTDFRAFALLARLPMAMTAHVVYTAIDAERMATLSPRIVRLIREEIGFDGLLLSDDIAMKALTGPLDARAHAVLDAGCDIVLFCNGSFAEREEVAAAARPMTDGALGRSRRAFAALAGKGRPFAAAEARERLGALLTRAA